MCCECAVAEKMTREQLGLDKPAEEEQAPTEGLAQQQVEPPVAAITANTSQRFVPYHRTLLGAAGIAARDARSSQVC